MNPMAILSPFLVMRKIILQLPVATLSELVVDGFPKTVTTDERTACFDFFKTMHSTYRNRLSVYHQAFERALRGGSSMRDLISISMAAISRYSAASSRLRPRISST